MEITDLKRGVTVPLEITLPIANGLPHTHLNVELVTEYNLQRQKHEQYSKVNSFLLLLVASDLERPQTSISYETSLNHLLSGWMITLLNMLMQGLDYQLEDIFFDRFFLCLYGIVSLHCDLIGIFWT